MQSGGRVAAEKGIKWPWVIRHGRQMLILAFTFYRCSAFLTLPGLCEFLSLMRESQSPYGD